MIPTGTIQLLLEGVPISGANGVLDASGNYSIPYAGLLAGANNVTAAYSGDSNFDPSVSPVDVQQVNNVLAASSTTLTSTPNPSNVGDSVNFSGAVSAAQSAPTKA
ncbi:MAG: Ig-like domain-containing protein [Candidatus Sulfotelmatobacter sp.]